MAVTINGSAATGIGITTGIYTAPTGIVSGELLVCVIEHGNATDVITAAPTGWTLAASRDDGHAAAPGHMLIYTKVATGSEPTTYTFTWNTSPGADVAIFRVGGQAASALGAIAGSAITTAQASPWSNPGLTTTATNSGVLFFWNAWNATVAIAGQTYTAPLAQVAGFDGAVYIAFATFAAIGATGAKTLSSTAGGVDDPGLSAIEILVNVAASAITMVGPTSGTVSTASTNFTVGANGSITGTITVTPSDGGAGGTFTPTTVAISSGTPTGTFTYTPASTGVKTISAANNGGLTAPSTIAYTSNAGGGGATTVTMSGPGTLVGGVGTASGNFTVGANGTITGTVVVTPADGGGGGSFTPSTVSINTGSPTGTFTYTPGTTGAKTISAANSGGLTAPGTIVYNSYALATTYSFAGPSSGSVGAPSTAFTVALPANTVVTAPVIVTPAVAGGTGSFSPSSVTLAANVVAASNTFTFTPSSAGVKTLSVTN